MPYQLSAEHRAIKDSVDKLCHGFPQQYWIELDRERRYPDEFVAALTREGWLSLLIPHRYGGGGGSITDAAVVLETIDRNGCSSSAADVHHGHAAPSWHR